jgi:hypothetical protein
MQFLTRFQQALRAEQLSDDGRNRHHHTHQANEDRDVCGGTH